MTIAERKKYLKLADNLVKEHAQISEEIYRWRLANSKEKIEGGDSGYPFDAIDAPDPWFFLTRECTSYAAWYWNVKLGKEWRNTQPGRGSARYWDEIARTLGYSISSTPRVGAIISWKGPLFPGDIWGHVAIVEAVNPNGTIDVSEYNWATKYGYSYRKNVDPNDYGAYVYIF